MAAFGPLCLELSALSARRLLAVSVLSIFCLGVLAWQANTPSGRPLRVPFRLAASPGWLNRFNQWRLSTGLAPVSENTTYSAGDYAHAEYMVKNDLVTHYETPGTPYYTTAGDTAARNSNIYVSSSTATTDQQAIDWWMQAPFHALGMMDPRLTTTGFGSYRESKSGWDMGAAVNVLQGNPFSGGTYPVYFPGNGTSEPLSSYGGYESPDPLQACSGYAAPTGLPVSIQVGGNVSTTAGAVHSFTGNGVSLAHCVIDSNNAAVGSMLKTRGAVILIPRQPLQKGVRYTVALTVNNTPYTWSFTVGPFFSLDSVSPGYGNPAGGTAVTITGSGFSGATAVSFGASTAASFTVVDDSTIHAITPAHAVGAVDVTVTTPTGTSPITPADRFAFATPCTSVTLAAAPSSPSPAGTSVTFTAASACPSSNPLYEFWSRPSANPDWQVVQAWSTNNTFLWNSSGGAGLVYIGLWARDANSPGIVNSGGMGSTDVYTSTAYTLTTATCGTATISAAPTSPQMPGTQVMFTAGSTGCPNPRYEFWSRPASSRTWTLVQAYSTKATYSWNSTSSTGVTYFGAWVKDASSPTSSFDANASTQYALSAQPCTTAALSASPASPQVAGTQITFTAGSSGCANPRYEFWMRPATSSQWTMVQGYSSTATYTWNSAVSPGSYYFGVWAKDASSSTFTYDSNWTVPFVLGHTCTGASISASPTSVAPGGHSTVTATASGCPAPMYEFWVRPATSSTWTMVQGYSTSATFDWNTTGLAPGTAYIGVWTKDASSPTSSFDKNATAAISVI